MAEITKESLPRHDKNQVPVEREFDQASFSSDETQTGVKTVEVVSQTWTQSALIAAYLGYVWSYDFLSFFKTTILYCLGKTIVQIHQVESSIQSSNGSL